MKLWVSWKLLSRRSIIPSTEKTSFSTVFPSLNLKKLFMWDGPTEIFSPGADGCSRKMELTGVKFTL